MHPRSWSCQSSAGVPNVSGPQSSDISGASVLQTFKFLNDNCQYCSTLKTVHSLFFGANGFRQISSRWTGLLLYVAVRFIRSNCNVSTYRKSIAKTLKSKILDRIFLLWQKNPDVKLIFLEHADKIAIYVGKIIFTFVSQISMIFGCARHWRRILPLYLVL